MLDSINNRLDWFASHQWVNGQKIWDSWSFAGIKGDGRCKIGQCFLALIQQLIWSVGQLYATLWVRIGFGHFLARIAKWFNAGTGIICDDTMTYGKRFAISEVKDVGQMLSELQLLRLVLAGRDLSGSNNTKLLLERLFKDIASIYL